MTLHQADRSQRKTLATDGGDGSVQGVVIRSSRVAAVVNELLGKAFAVTIVTDRFSSYSQYQQRKVCWSHLLRDFPNQIDAAEKLGRSLSS